MDIVEIELLTDTIEETSNFYSGLLGFEEVYADKETISFNAGQSVLTFKQSNNIKPKYHFAFNIPCNKIDEAIKWTSPKAKLLLTQKGEIISDFTHINAKSIYFYDNNKNILEFIVRFDLNNPSQEPFNIKSIEAISEIGIVTDNPVAFADKVVNENKLYFFRDSGPRSDEFVGVGNDNGIFIIVKANRKWHPTYKDPAERHYSKIKFRVNGLAAEMTVNDNSTE